MSEKTRNLILTIGGISVIFVIILLVGLFGNNNNNKKNKDGVLTVKENFFDFGMISMKNGNVSHRFALKNENSETITIKKIYTSCMCTTATLIDGKGEKRGIFGMPGHGDLSNIGFQIAGGETIEIEAIFDPAAHGPEGIGPVKRIIYIETDSQTNPNLQLVIEARVAN